MINKEIIDESFDFYEIDNKYKEKCYNIVNDICKNDVFKKSFENMYKILYEDDFEKIKKIWNEKDINVLFGDSIDPFITNLIILSGYKIHQSNMKKYGLDNNQIAIHKRRVKECFENDLINRQCNGVRISQMLWAAYFIRTRIIEIGSLQFEYEKNMTIKIHIPRNTNLDIIKVKESIDNSKIEINKIYGINNFTYICNSWLLSNQLNNLINKNTNISRFYDLFEVKDGGDCINDILNFVYNIDDCNNYLNLEENTSLQKIIKQELLNGNKFYLGNGILK